MDLKNIRESALRAALVAASAMLTTSFFTGCSSQSTVQPTTPTKSTETETMTQPAKRTEFEKVALSTYVNDKVKVDNLSAYTKFYDTGEALGSLSIGDTIRLYQGTEDTMYAGLDKDGAVLGYTEDQNSIKVNNAESYVPEKYSNLTYAVMTGKEHNYWFTGANAEEDQNNDALSGRYGKRGDTVFYGLYKPFTEPITVMNAEGSRVSLNVYTGTAIESFTKRWNSAREKAEENSGLLVNDMFYEHAVREENNKVYVDLMSLGESLDMTYSNMSFEQVIRAFGTNEEDVEFVSVIRNSDWGFAMHFVKFQEGSTETNDRVFVEYYSAGEPYLKELELGKFADNQGELLIVPDADAPLMYLNVQALEQILGLNGTLIKNDAGYVLEITQGDLKPKNVVIDDQQYTLTVLREELPDDYTKWDASSMTLDEAKEKIWADGEMSTEESLWLLENYKEELEKRAEEESKKNEEETKQETTQVAEKPIEKPVEQETTKPVEPPAETSSTPAETTPAPTTPTGGVMTATQQKEAARNSVCKNGSIGYCIASNRDSNGPGVNKTATASGMTGEAGRVIEFVDDEGYTWTAVTSGEVVYDPASCCFYDVVTPLTVNGEDVEIMTNGWIEKRADYYIRTSHDGRTALGDLRKSELRAF